MKWYFGTIDAMDFDTSGRRQGLIESPMASTVGFLVSVPGVYCLLAFTVLHAAVPPD